MHSEVFTLVSNLLTTFDGGLQKYQSGTSNFLLKMKSNQEKAFLRPLRQDSYYIFEDTALVWKKKVRSTISLQEALMFGKFVNAFAKKNLLLTGER